MKQPTPDSVQETHTKAERDEMRRLHPEINTLLRDRYYEAEIDRKLADVEAVDFDALTPNELWDLLHQGINFMASPEFQALSDQQRRRYFRWNKVLTRRAKENVRRLEARFQKQLGRGRR